MFEVKLTFDTGFPGSNNVGICVSDDVAKKL